MVFAQDLSKIAVRTSVNIPQRGCEGLRTDVTQPVMWTEEDGLRRRSGFICVVSLAPTVWLTQYKPGSEINKGSGCECA